ncbi:MAG: dihydrofolate reductase [Rickettsiaceae bacterium]
MALKKSYIIGIMSCDPDGVVGKNNSIPWYYHEDLEHFRLHTKNNISIMGYNTFVSIPDSTLSNMTNIVLTKKHKTLIDTKDRNIYIVSSLAHFLNIIDSLKTKQSIFMIGGAMIADLFLSNNLIDEFILTKIKHKHHGDARLNLNHFRDWSCEEYVNKGSNIADNQNFSILHYKYQTGVSRHQVNLYRD